MIYSFLIKAYYIEKPAKNVVYVLVRILRYLCRFFTLRILDGSYNIKRFVLLAKLFNLLLFLFLFFFSDHLWLCLHLHLSYSQSL